MNNRQWPNCYLLDLPLEIQVIIADTDAEAYIKWPLLCMGTATTSRYNYKLEKDGYFAKKFKNRKQNRKRVLFKNGKKIECKRYHVCGELYVKYSYRGNQRHGEFLMFFDNGQIHKSFSYKNGLKLEGTCKWWYSTGEPCKPLCHCTGGCDIPVAVDAVNKEESATQSTEL
mmetsp:Transcript_3741/g.4148  ORF Transcript_3741/g.4148 Transcript_3741/m.4148 type:complete len:171 (-) Transcript_3741:25-537(-)